MSERPEAMDYVADLEARDVWRREDIRLTVHCAAKPCSTRLGFVYDTPFGPLWVGFLGSQRDGRKVRRAIHAQGGFETDGRTIAANWLESPAPYHYMCDCKCRRNSADGPTVRAALLARKKQVRIPPPR